MAYTGKWIFNEKNYKFEFQNYVKVKDDEAKLRPLTPIKVFLIKLMTYKVSKS